MKHLNYFFLFLLVVFANFSFARDEVKIPKDLQPWVQWVSKDENKCVITQDKTKNCVYYHKLDLNKSNNKILFSLMVSLEKKETVYLPSGEQIFLNNVKANKKIIPFIENNNINTIFLQPGDYLIEGEIISNAKQYVFNTQFQPTIIYNNTSLQLLQNQKTITLQEKIKASNINQVNENITKEESLNLKVFRKLHDGNPSKLDTKIKITYSGPTKEIVLGSLIPSGFLIDNIQSTLSIKKNQKDFLVELKNGQHNIDIVAFSKKKIKELQTKGLVFNTTQEIWSIEQTPNLRQVTIHNAPIVNAVQVEAPIEWQHLSTHLVKDTILFKEEQVGIEKNIKQSATLERTIWLDLSDSKKYIISDNLTIKDNGYLQTEVGN